MARSLILRQAQDERGKSRKLQIVKYAFCFLSSKSINNAVRGELVEPWLEAHGLAKLKIQNLIIAPYTTYFDNGPLLMNFASNAIRSSGFNPVGRAITNIRFELVFFAISAHRIRHCAIDLDSRLSAESDILNSSPLEHKKCFHLLILTNSYFAGAAHNGQACS